MFMSLPLLLTWLRIALIPLFVVMFYLDPFLVFARPGAAMLFFIAGITDWLDGYFARKLNKNTKFGAFLDPVADKLLVVVALILLVSDAENGWRTLMALCAVIIIGRELTISALREWMAEIGKRTKVKVTIIAKAKTTFQMIAIVFMLYKNPMGGLNMYVIGFILLAIATVLTVWSMWIYLRASWPEMSAQMNSE
ncbi:MAG: CDP-diacylglycerol--glycerol-3-phosphate 3-phosphatidyltransferase [Gammaproteobacteria bacterium]|nr:CDP-diacylglycerol--glycerol-3-phosphate 3-phosphatidyltransferase [Gammaproteobacteria bacterium]